MFQCISVVLLPIAFGADGIWFSVVIAELLSTVTTMIFFTIKRKKYHY